MSKSTTVAVAGVALIGLNAWNGPQRPALTAALNGKAGSQPGAHKALLQMAGEALLVLVFTVAAGTSDAVGTGMVAAVVALWVLYGITYYTGRQTPKPAPASIN